MKPTNNNTKEEIASFTQQEHRTMPPCYYGTAQLQGNVCTRPAHIADTSRTYSGCVLHLAKKGIAIT